MRLCYAAMLTAPLLFLGACDQGPKSSQGFRLPDGDIGRGRQVYIDKMCSSCHLIEGMEDLRQSVDPELLTPVPIGGMQTRIATYGELVTAVVNPSHRIARAYRSEEFSEDGVSRMRNYNDELTVSELIDLVAFLQAQYREVPTYE